MIQRLLTGIVFLTAMIASILWDYYAFGALMGILTFIGTIEYYNLVLQGGAKPNMILGTTLSLLTYIIISWPYVPATYQPLVPLVPIIVVLLIFIVEMLRLKNLPFNNITHSIFPSLLIALPFAYIVRLSMLGGDASYNPSLILAYFGIIWVYDTFAYLVGRTLGKHKLAAAVSPNKTWEGAIGGLIIGIAFSIGMYQMWPFELSLLQWIVFAIIVMTTGTLGDLSISLLKRSVKAKDTGALLPGHGGILDRLDSELLSAPAAYFYLLFCLS